MENGAVQTIHVDHANKLVDVRLSGFFSAEDVGWTGEELRAAVRTLGENIGAHVTLYDVSDALVAPPETVEALKQSFANPAVRPLWARKVAFCASSALVRMQLKRLQQVRADIGVFEDRASALKWLLA